MDGVRRSLDDCERLISRFLVGMCLGLAGPNGAPTYLKSSERTVESGLPRIARGVTAELAMSAPATDGLGQQPIPGDSGGSTQSIVPCRGDALGA